MKTQRTLLEALIVPALLAGALFLFWRQLAWMLAWIVLVPVFILLLIVAASCSGLSESEWRRNLEPLLPEGIRIVESRTGNCTLEFNCTVRFVLEHDRTRYAEDVAAFETNMVAKGWERVSGGVREGSGRASFDRPGIRVYFTLLSASWWEQCIASRGTDDVTCQSTLTVHQR